MSAKRKKTLQEGEARLKKLRQRHQSVQILSGKEIILQREVEYIVRRASEHDARCVSLGALVFFSTESGDAWMLDTEDELGLCLARGGESQPVHIIETDTSMAVEWECAFSIGGNGFTTIDRKTGRITTVLGYPTQAILAAIQNTKEAQE